MAKEFFRQLAWAPGTGAALCIYRGDQPVLDIHGGVRDGRGTPWQADTLVMAFSTGKGCASTLLHCLRDAGLCDYDDAVVDHWPGFGRVDPRGDKARIRIRDVLSHRTGLHRLGDMVSDFHEVLDFDAMVARLERAQPAFTPGTASAYQGITYSFLIGELLRRIGGAPVAQLLQRYLVGPLDLDGAYFGLPPAEFARCAQLRVAHEPLTFGHHALGLAAPLVRLVTADRIRLDDLRAALVVPSSTRMSWNDPRLRRACLPSSTGVFTARSLARVFAMLGQGGTLDGRRILSPETVAALQQRQPPGRDRVMGVDPGWRLGYHGVATGSRRPANAFGHCGYRGTGAFHDPDSGLSIAFVHNAKGGNHPLGSGRLRRLTQRALACL